MTTRLELTQREELIKLRAENEALRVNLRGALNCLRGAITLIEAWAYGPAFKRAGVMWPDNNCNAPKYLEARRWLKAYDAAND